MGKTYRIAGIQLEEWKKRGHRHGISQNLTKERGNNVLLLFFLKMLLSWPRRKRGGKVKQYFCGRTVGFRMRKVIESGENGYLKVTPRQRCGCGVKISNTGTTNVGDVCYWPSIFGIPNLDTWLSCRCALTTPGIEPTQNSWNTQERGCNKQHVWWT